MNLFEAAVPNMDDEELAEWTSILRDANLAGSNADKLVRAEEAKRAEIRIARGEYGATHDASWYNSRQTEEQFLDEAYGEGAAQAIRHGHPDWSHAIAYGPCTRED
jgi:hypothetical protein